MSPVPEEESPEPLSPVAPEPPRLCATCSEVPVAGDDTGGAPAPFNGRRYCSLTCASPALLKSAPSEVQAVFQASAAASASVQLSESMPTTSSFQSHRNMAIAAEQAASSSFLAGGVLSRLGAVQEDVSMQGVYVRQCALTLVAACGGWR